MVSMGILSILLITTLIFLVFQKKHLQQLLLENKKLALEKNQLEINQQRSLVEKEQLQLQLQSSQYDPVTHLNAFYVFEDRLRQAIKEGERYNLTLGVMIIDLDGFKTINDALGHEVGDALLLETAKRLSACVRQVDSMTRQTKDRFVVLLAQLTKAERAAIVAARMLEAVSEPFQIGEHEFYMTACIGIAFYPADGQDADALLRHADNAVSVAKQKGKHLYQFHQEDVHLQSQRELALATELHKENIFQELQLCYQPIISLKPNESDKVFCMDVKLYWQHKDFGLITPNELFSYAESQRKTNIVCEWLVRKAAQQLVAWRAMGISFERIGIPVFMHQLENSQFVYQLLQLLQEYKIEPKWVVIEIKEQLSTVAFDKIASAINRFKYIGTKVAIGDFGVGYIPLHELKNLNIDYLKLDARCIQDIVDHPKARQFIKSLNAFAQGMDMTLIFQGVETPEQREAIKSLGGTLLQGHLLGSPLSVREVEDSLTLKDMI